ncbi:putative reverse transcriptase domain-containing protein [Tanacetum coccineum]
MAEPILHDNMEKSPTESNLSITSNDINIELNKEFLAELRKNINHGTYNEDVVDHIAKISKGDGKITTWEELIETFFYRFYPESYNGEDEMLYKGDNWGIDLIEFLSNINTSFKNNKKVDERTKKVLFHAWMNGNCNKRQIDDNILRTYSKASHIDEYILQKEKDPGSFTLPCFINNVCFDNALVDLGTSISVMPLLTYLNLGLGELAHTKLTVELANRTVKYPKGIAKNVLERIGKFTFLIDFIILDMPEDIKAPLILGRPFLSTARAKIDWIYRERFTYKTRPYMARENLRLINRSLDPLNGDYIKLNDLNEPFKLRRNQGDDLMPTIKEGEFICDDDDKKIHIDCAYNLKFSCMIGFEFIHVNFFSLLYLNVMSKKFHNSIIKDKMVYKGDNVVGALMNVPIFVGIFSVVTDFAFLEDMDAYHDEGMGDFIVGEPFLREVGIKARRFDGMITIYNRNDEVTYQMVRSHPRFKHHTNEQCNKIPPLLKVSENDEMNGISHAYQKLKGFYKGVLNLGPDYIRNAKTKEWLTRRHISVHEMEW